MPSRDGCDRLSGTQSLQDQTKLLVVIPSTSTAHVNISTCASAAIVLNRPTETANNQALLRAAQLLEWVMNVALGARAQQSGIVGSGHDVGKCQRRHSLVTLQFGSYLPTT